MEELGLHVHILYFCCISAGENLLHYLPHGGPDALDNGVQAYGASWPWAQKQSCVHEHYDVIQLSTSVGNSYIMNPSKLPEGLLVPEFLQINCQRTDNPEYQDINQNRNVTNVG